MLANWKSLTVIFSIVSVLLLTCCFSTHGRAAESDTAINMMLVLDASGSMWGQVGGKAKIVIAKESLVKVIDQIPDHVRAGLVAYGHRQKKDCDDVELLVPLQPVNKALLKEKVKSLNPKGMTPITLSIQKTADMLKAVEGQTTILLVSDGKETCERDPCALVKELKAQGIRFVMDVIGFDVNDEERQELECMAQAGDGTYYSAANAEDFLKAVSDSSKKAGRSELSVLPKRGDEPIEAMVAVLDPETQKVITDKLALKGIPCVFILDPGEYLIRVEDTSAANKPVKTEKVTLKTGQKLLKEISFGEGTIKVITRRDGKAINAMAKVMDQEGGKIGEQVGVLKKGFMDFHVPAGIYDVVVTDTRTPGSPQQTFDDITVESGKVKELTAEFSNGDLEVTVSRIGKMIKATVYAYPGESKSFVAAEKSKESGPAKMNLPVGDYRLEIRDDTENSRTENQTVKVKVEPGRKTEAKVEIPAAVIEVTVTRGGAPFDCNVAVMQAGVIKIVVSDDAKNGKAVFIVPPGKYDVVAQDYNSKKYPYPEKRSNGLTLEAGQTVKVQADF